MATAHCSVCGQILPELHQASEVASAESSATATSTTCGSCRLKLAAKGSSARTTILRPAGSLQVDGRPILGPDLGAEAPAVIRIAPEQSSDSSVALRIVPAGSAASEVPGEAAVLSKQFGSYEILGEISRGSFGVVYKARQQGLDRIVALKVLLAGVHASAEAVARFQREAKAVAKLKHKNIVPVYDIGTQEGHHYFAMEFVEGDALSTLITRKEVSTPQALAFTEALADAIDSAHRAGVIHRDIKPSNIIVDRGGEPHITDFGLAKQVDLDTKYTVSGTTLGTPAYMPPEQARGEIERIDARSDVYAVGAVLYEMLTGRTPFVGRSLLEVVVAVINEAVAPPRQLNPKIHRDIQTIVLKCLEKDPRRRYQSAAELRDDVSRFRSGEPIHAKPVGLVRRGAQFLWRQAPLLGSMAVVLLAVGYAALKTRRSELEFIQKVDEKVDERVAEEKKKIEAERQAHWLPRWWFPAKKSEDLKTHELAKRYAVPPGREKAFAGLIPGRSVPDLFGESLRKLPGAQTLVSDEDSRFFGDVDAEVLFRLDEQGVGSGIRIGLQNVRPDYHGIPYVLELVSGRLSLVGPVELFSHTNQGRELRLEVKAERDSPALIPGDYTLRIRREGIGLSFNVLAPKGVFSASVEIKDANLSNWVFKETQLVLRSPAPGVQVLAAEVRVRDREEDVSAFDQFYTGEYHPADWRLQKLASSDDALIRARALYHRALIEELTHPDQPVPALPNLYTEALVELQKVRDESKLTQVTNLRRQLQLRRAISFAKNRAWDAFRDELKQCWREEEKIGEPLAWELQGLIEKVLKLGDTSLKLDAALTAFQRLGLPPGCMRLSQCARELGLLLDTRCEDLLALHRAYPTPLLYTAFFRAVQTSAASGKVGEALRLLEYVMPLVRLESEREELTRCAATAVTALVRRCAGSAVTTAERSRGYADAAGLVRAFKSPKLVLAVCEELERQLGHIADEDFELFRTTLLPALIANLADDTARTRFSAAIEKLAQGLNRAGRRGELRKLHEAIRPGDGSRDERMAAVFADAIEELRRLDDPDQEALALELLRYCYQHVAMQDPALQRAASQLAREKANVDRGRYSLVLAIQREYPTPELIGICEEVLARLREQRRYEDAALFFRHARVAFPQEGSLLIQSLRDTLRYVEPDEQIRLLARVAQEIQNELEQRPDLQTLRQWRLELADVELALNRWKSAREIYKQLFAQRDAETVLVARAGLRLAALSCIHPEGMRPEDFLAPLLALQDLPDELKLAIRLIATPTELELPQARNQLRALGGPALLSESEWALLTALRQVREGAPGEALEARNEADNRAGPRQIWVRAIASQLFRSTQLAPEQSPE